KTYMPGAKAIVSARRCAYTSTLVLSPGAGPASRSRITVAARRGTAGGAPDSVNRRAASTNAFGARVRFGSVSCGPSGSVTDPHHHRGALSDSDTGGGDGVPAALAPQFPGGIHDDPGG